MEITNNYSNYATSSTNTTKNAGSTKDSNVTTSTVELKTSTGGTKTEQIKTGYSNVNDYSKYLQEKYSYMNTGTTSMQGVPTTVSVSSAFLKKCMNDPEKAKYLEENLAALPDCASYAVSHAQGTLTSIEYRIDANGNITGISSGTNCRTANYGRRKQRIIFPIFVPLTAQCRLQTYTPAENAARCCQPGFLFKARMAMDPI